MYVETYFVPSENINGLTHINFLFVMKWELDRVFTLTTCVPQPCLPQIWEQCQYNIEISYFISAEIRTKWVKPKFCIFCKEDWDSATHYCNINSIQNKLEGFLHFQIYLCAFRYVKILKNSFQFIYIQDVCVCLFIP